MCGISGVVNKNNMPVEPRVISEMNELIAHRGPDGDGFYFGENFAFGHRRLAILDLTDLGKQPMEYGSKITITYNGEVYNFIELRHELEAVGYSFNSTSDTEIILAAYLHWGTECVNHFNGMWGFCIHDREKQLLFCSRDRFGIKPFYFLNASDLFIFGSEIKQLLLFQTEKSCNQQLVLDYLISGVEEYSNQTFFLGIEKLEQGHNLIYDLSSHTYEIKSYYNLEQKEAFSNVSEDEAIRLYRNQLADSVKLRMRSDVEVGTCLSGGLDSSSITALSAQVLKDSNSNTIKAIHARVDDKTIDESGFAKLVANHCQTDLILVEPNVEDFVVNLDKVIQIQEEPFGSPSIFLQYFVLQKARERKCLVMLDGQGGDETLLGYERYYPAFLMQKKGVHKFKEFIVSSKNSRLSKVDLLKYYFYFTNYKIRLKRLKKRNKFIKSAILNKYESAILKELSSKYLDISAIQKLEIGKTQLPHLLKYEDKNSMANSVETRLPFLDYRCVELAYSLPNHYKIKAGWTKNILRKAMEDKLPNEVVWRKNKLGFNAPEAIWLHEINTVMLSTIERSELLRSIVELKFLNFDKLDLRTKWRLFNLARWAEFFNMSWTSKQEKL